MINQRNQDYLACFTRFMNSDKSTYEKNLQTLSGLFSPNLQCFTVEYNGVPTVTCKDYKAVRKYFISLLDGKHKGIEQKILDVQVCPTFKNRKYMAVSNAKVVKNSSAQDGAARTHTTTFGEYQLAWTYEKNDWRIVSYTLNINLTCHSAAPITVDKQSTPHMSA